jgi:hypothetical protein
MQSFNPAYAGRTFDPRPLVATIADERAALAAARREMARYAEDCPTFRANDRAMRSNRGVL